MLHLLFPYITLTFLILRFSVTVFNFLSNPKLGNYSKWFSDKVTLIIQVSDNATGLIHTLNSIVNQNYPHIEVFIVQTANGNIDAESKAYCKSDSRFFLRKKSSFTIEEATGEYLLFLEPDMLIQDAFINSLIYRTKVLNLALLNIIPTFTLPDFRSRLLLPLREFVLLNLNPLRLVRLFNSPVFSASGNSCMFFETRIYKNTVWHKKTDWKPNADAEMVRSLKQDGHKVETLLGNKLIYITVGQQEKGLFLQTGRQLLKVFNDSIFVAILYMFLVVAGPLILLLNQEYLLLILPAGLIFLSRIMISFLTAQQPFWNILLHPIQMILLLASLSSAIYAQLSRPFMKKS